jgi:hypothetical protein
MKRMDLSVKSFCFSGSQVLLVEKGNALVPLNVRSSEDPIGSPFDALAAADRDIQSEAVFRRVIAIERKRTERSKQPFLLMLLEAGNQPGSKEEGKALENMGASLVSSSRDTDVVGWYRDGITVGVLFTGLGSKDKGSILGTILTRVTTRFQRISARSAFHSTFFRMTGTTPTPDGPATPHSIPTWFPRDTRGAHCW